MNWFDQYWDLVDDYYWNPKQLGLQSIPKDVVKSSNGITTIPTSYMNPHGGPLYRRVGNTKENFDRLHSDEVALNHALSLALAIASDEILSEVLFRPLGLNPKGAITSVGKNISSYFELGRDETLTQHDGFYVSEDTALGVEIKLEADTHTDQVPKYVFLLMNEEIKARKKKELGLLYIVPQNRIEHFETKLRLPQSTSAAHFLEKTKSSRKPRNLDKLIISNEDAFTDAFSRLKTKVISWTYFHDCLLNIALKLPNQDAGNKTASNLLLGLGGAVKSHNGTGFR